VWEIPLVQGCFTDYSRPRGTEINCVLSDTVVNPWLTSPLSLHPVPPATPFEPYDTGSRCVDRSNYPAWTVHSFKYQHHGSAMIDTARDYSEISLNLTNLGSNENLACTARYSDFGAKLPNGSVPWIQCRPRPADTNTSAVASTTVSTFVSFDIDHGVLGLTQTWNCSDGIAGIDAYVLHILFVDCR
jgi:hypothetical protein